MKRIRIVLALIAAAVAVGVGFSSTRVEAQDCTPTCFKNPITGQITCTYPCP